MARFSPLVLPSQLVALPQNYGQRLPFFYGSSEITTRQHVDKLVDFINLKEVDDEDAKMIIIAQSFSREVKKWFRGLMVASITNSRKLKNLFLAR